MIKTKGGINIYIDPFRISPDTGENQEDKADFIFITHSHYDHCSIEDIRHLTKNGTRIISTPDCQSKFKHISENIQINVAEADSKSVFENEKIKYWCVRAYNVDKKYHPREEDWVGYLIQIGDEENLDENVLIYHAGDTDFIPEMKNIENIDIAFLPIGGAYTMNAGEAAKAASIIKPKLAIPMHFGKLEGVGSREDAEIFVRLCSGSDVDARILTLGS
jgi:L-ascorbate metabolism protein UlaG (beta-lactamase superfamily)